MSAPSLPALPFSHWQLAWSLEAGRRAVRRALPVGGAPRTRGRWPLRRTASFLAAIACVLVALQSGLDDLRRAAAVRPHGPAHAAAAARSAAAPGRASPSLLALRALPPSRRRALAGALAHLRRFTGPAPSLLVLLGRAAAHAPAVVLRGDAAPPGAARGRARAVPARRAAPVVAAPRRRPRPRAAPRRARPARLHARGDAADGAGRRLPEPAPLARLSGLRPAGPRARDLRARRPAAGRGDHVGGGEHDHGGRRAVGGARRRCSPRSAASRPATPAPRRSPAPSADGRRLA